jgi:hypothetical protein
MCPNDPQCAHGRELEDGCAACDTEGFEPEPSAQEEPAPAPPSINGGW